MFCFSRACVHETALADTDTIFCFSVCQHYLDPLTSNVIPHYMAFDPNCTCVTDRMSIIMKTGISHHIEITGISLTVSCMEAVMTCSSPLWERKLADAEGVVC